MRVIIYTFLYLISLNSNAALIDYEFTAKLNSLSDITILTNDGWEYLNESLMGNFLEVGDVVSGKLTYSTDSLTFKFSDSIQDYYSGGIVDLSFTHKDYVGAAKYNDHTIIDKDRSTIQSFNSTEVSSSYTINNFALTDMHLLFYGRSSDYADLNEIDLSDFSHITLGLSFTKNEDYSNTLNAYHHQKPWFDVFTLKTITSVPEPSSLMVIIGLMFLTLQKILSKPLTISRLPSHSL